MNIKTYKYSLDYDNTGNRIFGHGYNFTMNEVSQYIDVIPCYGAKPYLILNQFFYKKRNK